MHFLLRCAPSYVKNWLGKSSGWSRNQETEISKEAEMRNCFIEANASEEGSERMW